MPMPEVEPPSSRSEQTILQQPENTDLDDIDALLKMTIDEQDAAFEDVLHNAQVDEDAELFLNLQLQEAARKTVDTLSAVTADTYQQGAALAGQVFGGLASVIGSCGVFCVHGLGSVGNTLASNSIGAGLSGAGSAVSITHSGNQITLSGDRADIAARAGITLNELGNYSAEDIISRILETMQCFGECVHSMSFGIIDSLADSFFGLLPNSN